MLYKLIIIFLLFQLRRNASPTLTRSWPSSRTLAIPVPLLARVNANSQSTQWTTTSASTGWTLKSSLLLDLTNLRTASLTSWASQEDPLCPNCVVISPVNIVSCTGKKKEQLTYRFPNCTDNFSKCKYKSLHLYLFVSCSDSIMANMRLWEIQ